MSASATFFLLSTTKRFRNGPIIFHFSHACFYLLESKVKSVLGQAALLEITAVAIKNLRKEVVYRDDRGPIIEQVSRFRSDFSVLL